MNDIETEINSIFDDFSMKGLRRDVYVRIFILIIQIMKNYDKMKGELIASYLITVNSFLRDDDDDEIGFGLTSINESMRNDLLTVFG